MRLLVTLAAAVLVLAGCSSNEASTTPAKRGCDGFDKQAMAKALGTTATIAESAADDGNACHIDVGPEPATTGVIVSIGPDNDRGFASWRKIVADTGVRDLAPANGDKAFVSPAPRQYESMAGVSHNGTFYRISILTKDFDPVKAATAMVDVLEAALG